MDREFRSEEEQKAAQSFEREQAWQAKREEVEQVTDRLGFPIEPRIKETVIGLNLFEINTTQSCEGHPDRGMGAPWVEIATPNEPGWRFVGQKEIFEKVAEQYGVSLEAVLHADNEEAWQVAWQITARGDPTPTAEYQAWEKESQAIREEAGALLSDFYTPGDVESPSKLFIDDDRIHNGGSDFMLVEEMTEEQQAGLPDRLASYQSEMERFAGFIREKYIASPSPQSASMDK